MDYKKELLEVFGIEESATDEQIVEVVSSYKLSLAKSIKVQSLKNMFSTIIDSIESEEKVEDLSVDLIDYAQKVFK